MSGQLQIKNTETGLGRRQPSISESADSDRELIEEFIQRGLATHDLRAFWGYFIAAITRNLAKLPEDEIHFQKKSLLAAFWLHGFLHNFYGGAAEVFYWKPERLRQAAYQIGMELGVQILPIFPYSPAPDIRSYDADFWSRRSELPAIKIDLDACCERVRQFAASFRHEYEALPFEKPFGSPPFTYFANNSFYNTVDGYILYSLIRQHKPRRIIEIGSGNSTYLAAHAIARNCEDASDYTCDLTAIEPFPNDVLRAGFPGLTRLIAKPVQEVPVSEFQTLKQNDILFIDSSHVVRTGSDVVYEFLEILPRLQKGVLIHFHDVFLPYEYPYDWTANMNRYWTEQYILQSFLTFNDAFEVILPCAYLFADRPEVLEESFRSFHRSHGWAPSNFWIQKTVK